MEYQSVVVKIEVIMLGVAERQVRIITRQIIARKLIQTTSVLNNV